MVCYLGWILFALSSIAGLVVLLGAVGAQVELGRMEQERKQRLDEQRETAKQ